MHEAEALRERLARQDEAPVELRAEFLAHMKVEFKDAFEEAMLGWCRAGGGQVRTYVPTIPGGPRPTLAPEERVAALSYEDMPQVQVGFQYKESLCPAFRRRFLGRGLFEDVPRPGLSRDFQGMGLDDARMAEVRIVAACPFVIVVDERNLGGAPEPRGWEDLLDPRLEGKVCFNGTKYGCDLNVLLFIARRFGEEGLERLRRNVARSCHASRMVRYMGTSRNGGAGVYVMSSFFAHVCASAKPRCHMVWPAEGAACQPIFVMGKKGSLKRYPETYSFLLGSAWGQRLADNYFPSTNPLVDNRLEGPDGGRLDWFGWDFILRDDIDAIVARIDALFGDVPGFEK